MPILGAHQSTAGGYHKAIQRAVETGCDCVQLFTKNCNQWKAAPITAGEAEQFRTAARESEIGHLVSHDSYLINLASPDDDLWRRSIDAFIVELQRADTLGIPYVVTHPGAYTTGTPEGGLRRVAEALDEVHRQTTGLHARCLLETTAGQGTCLGWQFEQLAAILDGVREPDRLGVCLDTCHIFAAGYPLGTAVEYAATMDALAATVGIDRVKAIHLNDSRRELGSRVDRHDHIGRGKLGLAPFRNLLRDPRFHEVPMYLETPKAEEDGEAMDCVNLRVLRELTKKKRMKAEG